MELFLRTHIGVASSNKGVPLDCLLFLQLQIQLPQWWSVKFRNLPLYFVSPSCSCCSTFQDWAFAFGYFDPETHSSACQLPVDNSPEWKPLSIWFPGNTFLQSIPITVLCEYSSEILEPSIAKTTLSAWIWYLDSMKGQYYSGLLQFNTPSQPPLCCSISPGIWHILLQPPLLIQYFIIPNFFLKIFNGKEVQFFYWVWFRNSQESDTKFWSWKLISRRKLPSDLYISLFSFLFFFFLFTATPVAYGSSQARGQIGAAAEAYVTVTATLDPSCICNLHHSLCQLQILNTLSKARDQTHILTETIFCP